MAESNLAQPFKEHNLTEAEYQKILTLMGREPNYLELALFGVMWSEHCGYKNSKAQLKKFPTTGPQVLQGPGENAGVVDLGDGLACAFKMESHNHPSAIEPFQGAATGVGGIIRDIFAMGARPIASLDSLRFGDLSQTKTRHLLDGVVDGIGGYGNCIGIPTVGGEIFFHPSFQGNPLVNAMCVGLLKSDRVFKGSAVGLGNIVMLVGAQTGRDGIKGASFASEELSDQDPDKRPNVQVGDPFMEKLLLEATLEILDADLVVGLQDLGAAGLTSSGAEMAGRSGNGITLNLEKAPLREPDLTPWEIMLSESQERMLLVVEPEKVAAIERIFDKWDLLAVAVGLVTDDGHFTLKLRGEVIATIPAAYLTEEVPIYLREQKEPAYHAERKKADLAAVNQYGDFTDLLYKLLASPNLCSRAYVYERYDHMVGLNTVIRPGGDAALLRLPDSKKGLALTVDADSRQVFLDPYQGGVLAVVEAALNVAVTGARPLALTNCLNFGNPEDPEIYWQFVKATDGLAEAARALETPVTGGNVSFYNEHNGAAIYPTPTIGMVGSLEDLERRVTIAFKEPGDLIYLLGQSREELGASEAHYLLTKRDEGPVPQVDLNQVKALCRFLEQAAQKGLLRSAHDCSAGGLAVAIAESAMASDLGGVLNWRSSLSSGAAFFGESAGRVLVTLKEDHLTSFLALAKTWNQTTTELGRVGGPDLSITHNEVTIKAPVASLKKAWREALADLAAI
ncbi:MAG: phosphoribosylformylglycinamidine synthase subunit PurL [Deltaproteobacteria bacterium]|jgi:phosphoribosylformylglycinamidine synthase|nr:phosphoribosylformylglycinamidine synthase subunit PurL [Deltaproteobacteria bacterium]